MHHTLKKKRLRCKSLEKNNKTKTACINASRFSFQYETYSSPQPVQDPHEPLQPQEQEHLPFFRFLTDETITVANAARIINKTIIVGKFILQAPFGQFFTYLFFLKTSQINAAKTTTARAVQTVNSPVVKSIPKR